MFTGKSLFGFKVISNMDQRPNNIL